MNQGDNRDEWFAFLRQNANASSRNWTVTLLLSVFLGLFGIDRLYLGQYGLGLLKFATAGGMGFWWLHDVIAILCNKMRDAEDGIVKRPQRRLSTTKSLPP